MVSLFRIIKLKFSKGIIKYWFMPRYNSLRVHLLGLTIAFIILLIHLGLFTFNTTYEAECCRWIIEADYQSLAGLNSIVYSIIIILWFGLVTYYFGFWAILTLFLLIYIGIRSSRTSLL